MASTLTASPPERRASAPAASGGERTPHPGVEPEVTSARPSRRGVGMVLFALAFSFYLVTGLILMLHYGYHAGDAISRTANASYVLFSRYPHLAAIGFVWNPLPSLVEIPILMFTGAWPALLHQGAAGAFMSAGFMAGAVVQVRGVLRDRDLSGPWVWGLTAIFALNPMVVLYGGNGLSEAPYLFFTIWAVRRLIRWMHSDKVSDLVVAGIALGLDFLTRYETVAIAFGATALVVLVTYGRSDRRDERRRRRSFATLDGLLVFLPFALSFFAWAGVGWILTGNAFSQFSSVYGNTSQTAVNGGLGTRHLNYSIAQVMGDVVQMELFVLVAIVIALFLAIRRRDPDFFPSLTLFGAGIAFVMLSYVTGQTIQNFRYYILAIPLTIFAVAMIPARGANAVPSWSVVFSPAAISGPSTPESPSRRIGRVLGTSALALVLLAPAIPVMVHAMLDQSVDLSDYGTHSVLNPERYPPSQNDQIVAQPYAQSISDYLDTLHVANGSILIDTWEGYSIVMTADHMKQFVITSDYDFTRDLNDPARFGVRYLMVPQPKGIGSLDALNRRYPTLWSHGAGISTLVLQFDAPIPSLGSWRLYRLQGNPPSGREVTHA